MTSVLVVDDDRALLRTLTITLRGHGYEVHTASSGRAALEAGREQSPAVVILDLGLPDLSGVQVLRELRGYSQVPVIVLSARAGSEDKVEALDVGADDYVTKPFGTEELLARVRAAVRRSGVDQPETVRTDDFTIDLAAKQVRRHTPGPDGGGAGSTEVRLTPIEWGLVTALVTRPGRLVPQRELLREVWGPQYGEEANYLRVHMGNVRRKLETNPSYPRYFITEPGMGYRFIP